MTRSKISIFISCTLFFTCCFFPAWPLVNTDVKSSAPLHSTVLEVGPITLDREYHSMVGPGASSSFLAKDLFSAKQIMLQKIKVPNSITSSTQSTHPNFISSIDVATKDQSRKPTPIYWLKGASIDTVDERGRLLPDAPYLCHADILVFRQRQRTNIQPAVTNVIGLSPGLTKVILPKGFAVPVSSDSLIKIYIHATNRSPSVHKRIKFRLLIYSIKGGPSKQSQIALSWCRPDIIVRVKNSQQSTVESCCSEDCISTSAAEDSPIQWKGKLIKNNKGWILSKHWMVPPGVHAYQDSITNERVSNFSSNSPIYAVWAHVHPYCQRVSLIEYLHHRERILFTVHCQTTTSPQLDLKHVDYLTFPKGLSLNKQAKYGLKAVYNNTSTVAQDAMVEVGILYKDQQSRYINAK